MMPAVRVLLIAFTELSNEAGTELAQIMTKDLAKKTVKKLVDDCLQNLVQGRFGTKL